MNKLTDERLEEIKALSYRIGSGDYRDLISAIDELQTLRQKLEDGRLVQLPAPLRSTFFVHGDAQYPVTFNDVGIWVQRGEEGEWYTMEDVDMDIHTGLYAAEAAEKVDEE